MGVIHVQRNGKCGLFCHFFAAAKDMESLAILADKLDINN